jgi:hypothetical protein
MSNYEKLTESMCAVIPKLNDVLMWFHSQRGGKFTEFKSNYGAGGFSYDNGEKIKSVFWDLNYCCLKDQSNELIDFLASLI